MNCPKCKKGFVWFETYVRDKKSKGTKTDNQGIPEKHYSHCSNVLCNYRDPPYLHRSFWISKLSEWR